MFLEVTDEKDGVFWEKLSNNKNFVIGKCIMQPNSELFSHRHRIAEYYYVLSGETTMLLDKKNQKIKKDSFIKIPKMIYHYTKNYGKEPLVFLYFFPEGPFEKIEYL